MGHRISAYFIESGECTCYSSSWGGSLLGERLFWGHDFGVSWLKRLEKQNRFDPHYRDEGGVVVDYDNRRLSFYCECFPSENIPLRRTYLALLKCTWENWEIVYCQNELADILDIVDPPSKHESLVEGYCELGLPREVESGEHICSVFSVESNGVITLFPVDFDCDAGCLPSVEFVEYLPVVEGRYSYELNLGGYYSSVDFPNCGFHLCMDTKALHFWLNRQAVYRDFMKLSDWDGYELVYHGERFEDQLERCRGQLTYPLATNEDRLDALKKQVFLERYPDYLNADSIRSIAKRDLEEIWEDAVARAEL